MRLPRHGSTATRLVVFVTWISLLAAFAACSAAAEEKLPAYPPALTPELSPPLPAQTSRPAAKLAVTVALLGAAAKERPLPVGASPSVRIRVRNTGISAPAKITLTLRIEGMKAENLSGWRSESGALITEIQRLGAGAETERTLKLRVDSAPASGQTYRIFVEARSEDGAVASGEANLRVYDCADAYRSKLSALRSGVLQAVKDAADAMQRPDPALPSTRAFPATGVRTGTLANAERLAAAFAGRGGADMEFAREDARFMIQRWTAELSAYAGQDANPGLCAGNYYMVAGYREGLLSITRRLEAIHTAAANALVAARNATKADDDENLGKLARRAAKAADLKIGEESATVFVVLAAARASLGNDRKLEPEQAEMLSLVETATWLAETDKRAEALAKAIEQTFTTLSIAHRESCICAF